MKEFIKDLCLEAGEILLHYFDQDLKRQEKENAGFVTEADLASEKYLKETIKKHYPESDFICEESGEELSGKKYKWIIDPLDGTTNYANKIPIFCISIAVEEDNVIKYGAIYNPINKEFFYTEKDKPSLLNDKEIQISSKKEFAEAVLGAGDYYYRGEFFKNSMKKLTEIYNECQSVRVMGSLALAMAYTACGKFDGIWHEHANYWDVAAGTLLIRQAGGHVTDFQGNNIKNGNLENMIASNDQFTKILTNILSSA
ncbi:MAG: inositol monophosphatase [Pseudomonadota bacterium]